MESNLREKRLRNECIDRISDLPDSILGEILSHLPVKNVVATSILSTRWKNLFPSEVPLKELDLHYSSRRNCFDSSSRHFMEFVDKLFNVTLRDVHYVKRVFLKCEDEFDEFKILSWVSAALRLNVEHLSIMSTLIDSELVLDILDGCTTLVELELGNHFELCLLEECILPNLKRLSLYSLLLYDNQASIHELIDGCPMLDELRLVGCNFSVLDTLYIRHPLINKLFIEGCINQAECRVVIDTPNLEVFSYNGPSIAKYVVKNFKSFHAVCIEFDCFGGVTDGKEFHCNDRRLAKLVNACSSTRRLCFSGDSMMALYHSSVPLPTFQNLTWLVLGRMGTHKWIMLDNFLTSAPNLTTLTFQEELDFERAYVGFKSLLRGSPVCLELRLKKIEFWGFGGLWRNEIKLIEYFLKKGRVLQELIVYCLPYGNSSTLEKLSMLPRCSKACQVLFREKDTPGKSRYARDYWFKTRHD